MRNTHTTHLILASASPRRHELLQQLNIDFEVHETDIDETPLKDEHPETYVLRMAESKARVAYQSICGSDKKLGFTLILAADTSVICDKQILGKPLDRADARKQLQTLSGRSHSVLSAIALAQGNAVNVETIQSTVSQSTVKFASLSAELIEAYLETDEPYDKAGSYAVQGLAAQFIEKIEGSYSGIMGLPLFETSELLKPYVQIL